MSEYNNCKPILYYKSERAINNRMVNDVGFTARECCRDDYPSEYEGPMVCYPLREVGDEESVTSE